jgi:hypothetical protein
VARSPDSRLIHVMRVALTCWGCPLRALAMSAPTGGLCWWIHTVRPVASAVANWIAGAEVLIRLVPDMLSRIWRVISNPPFSPEGKGSPL